MTATAGRWGVPGSGITVPRERIVAALDGGARGLTVLAAPSGYGKTVAVAQYSAVSDAHVLWIPMRGARVSYPDVLTLVASAARQGAASSCSRIARPSAGSELLAANEYLGALLADSAEFEVVLVLDDLEPEAGSSVASIARELERDTRRVCE